MNGEEIAFVDAGDVGAPAALFVHGVLVNADLWRNVIFDVADLRRCVAVDLPAHGASPAGSDAADLSLTGLATMLDGLCAVLSLDQVDVVANDTGGAVAQVFAARYPGACPLAHAHQLRRARQLPTRAVQAVRRAGAHR